MTLTSPKSIIYAQHGWIDTDYMMNKLAQSLATPDSLVIAPNLGWLNTCWRIENLITQLENHLVKTISKHPEIPIKIIGHSLGGLIWLEILHRHPEYRQQIHSLVLLGSPVAGADLARIIDPFELGIGIARDLGKNRLSIAQTIAQTIPTLVVAGDIDNGGDGTVTVESTKFNWSKFVCIPGVRHDKLRNHPSVIKTIRQFWASPQVSQPTNQGIATKIIQWLQTIPGMTAAHRRNFYHSKVYLELVDGTTIRTWKNLLGVDHVFVANSEGYCLFAGYVGWIHSISLYKSLRAIAANYR